MENQDRMNMDSKEKRNNYIYILKALAIFSVICAHATPLAEGSSKWNMLSAQVLDYLGTFGVPVFFCISGYLFGGNTRTWRAFWKRKATTLFCHGSAVRHYCGSMWCSGRVESVCLHGCCSSWDIITRHIILQY